MLRDYWAGCFDTVTRSTFTREEAALQMLAVATHAVEQTFGAEVAARFYTDQAVMLTARRLDAEKTAAALVGAPRH